MKKNFFKFLVLATLNLTSSKAVANDVPSTQENFSNHFQNWIWESFANSDGMLCKSEGVKYPLLMPKRSSRFYSDDENKNDNYSLLTKKYLVEKLLH